MKVVPLGDNVAVRRLEAEETTAGGVFLPEGARKIPLEGRVLSIGDGRLLANGARTTYQVREGDRVLFSPHAGTELNVDKQGVLIMHEDQIIAVLE